MPSLRHGKQAAQEQQENADAANLESSAEQAKRERDAAKPLEQSIKEQAGVRSHLEDIQKVVELAEKDSKKLFEQMKAGLGQPKDTFQAAGPEGASQTQRDELRHAQQELLQQEQDVAQRERFQTGERQRPTHRVEPRTCGARSVKVDRPGCRPSVA